MSRALPAPTQKVGLYLAMGSMTMVFAALASAYLVRMGMEGWTSVRLGGFPLLWLNTGVLVAASVALVQAERTARETGGEGSGPALLAAAVLGSAFLVGQGLAWVELAGAGVGAAGNPAGGFFYLITGLHGLHIFGGLGGLGFVWLRRLRQPRRAPNALGIELVATYWHFLLLAWLLLFGLMLVA